jgi:hypothetical protein
MSMGAIIRAVDEVVRDQFPDERLIYIRDAWFLLDYLEIGYDVRRYYAIGKPDARPSYRFPLVLTACHQAARRLDARRWLDRGRLSAAAAAELTRALEEAGLAHDSATDIVARHGLILAEGIAA